MVFSLLTEKASSLIQMIFCIFQHFPLILIGSSLRRLNLAILATGDFPDQRADRHGLHVYTRDRDEEVRAVTIIDDMGDTYGLSVIPLENGRVRISVGLRERAQRRTAIPERKARRPVVEVPPSELSQALEACYSRVEAWIAESGHTRTSL